MSDGAANGREGMAIASGAGSISGQAAGQNGPSGSSGGVLKRILRAFGLAKNGGSSVRETLEELIEEDRPSAEAEIDAHEQALIRNVLGLRDITSSDVMVPRADIVSVEIDTPLDALAARMVDGAHSRLPVYRETLDDAVGMVHIKDVLGSLHSDEPRPLEALVREVLFVAPSIRALDLLQEMRLTRRHVALVVDEFGGIDGLITVEDLVEEIVGEISDEHDVEEGPRILMRPDGSVLVDARTTVEEFEEEFGELLSDEEREEIDTVGGLVFSIAGRVATRGEVLKHESGIEFEVVDADSRRIHRVRLRRHRPSVPDEKS